MKPLEASLPHRSTRMVRTVRGILLAFCALTLVVGCEKEVKTQSPPTVEVADVVREDVPIFAEWVGTMDGMVNATIRAQVQGYLIKQNYKEGDPGEERPGAL